MDLQHMMTPRTMNETIIP